MKRAIVLCAALTLLAASGPPKIAEASTIETCNPVTSCRLNLDCSWTSICAYCTGEAVVAGGKGECKAAGQT
jgi:hypothetical protein